MNQNKLDAIRARTAREIPTFFDDKQAMLEQCRRDIDDLLSEVECMREALEFYADEENYYQSEKVIDDSGQIAREALK